MKPPRSGVQIQDFFAAGLFLQQVSPTVPWRASTNSSQPSLSLRADTNGETSSFRPTWIWRTEPNTSFDIQIKLLRVFLIDGLPWLWLDMAGRGSGHGRLWAICYPPAAAIRGLPRVLWLTASLQVYSVWNIELKLFKLPFASRRNKLQRKTYT